jgi:hypothetical protein
MSNKYDAVLAIVAAGAFVAVAVAEDTGGVQTNRSPSFAWSATVTIASETDTTLASNAMRCVTNYLSGCLSGQELTNTVNRLVKEGKVCQVIGHKWERGCGMGGCLVLHAHEARHCLVCKKTETQEPAVWK